MGVTTGVTAKDKKHKYHTTNNLWANRPFFVLFSFKQWSIIHVLLCSERNKWGIIKASRGDVELLRLVCKVKRNIKELTRKACTNPEQKIAVSFMRASLHILEIVCNVYIKKNYLLPYMFNFFTANNTLHYIFCLYR